MCGREQEERGFSIFVRYSFLRNDDLEKIRFYDLLRHLECNNRLFKHARMKLSKNEIRRNRVCAATVRRILTPLRVDHLKIVSFRFCGLVSIVPNKIVDQ